MPSNEPEIVTRAEIKREADSLMDLYSKFGDKLLVQTFVSKQRVILNTIELFAGLLEEPCGCYLSSCGREETWVGCDNCKRKAAALRRYRGE